MPAIGFIGEEWRPVPGWEEIRVRRILTIKGHGDVKFLKPSCVSGYHSVVLYRPKKQVYVHRLVAKAFLNQPDEISKNRVNHIDANKINNVPSNLEWVTPRRNTVHAFELGLIRRAGIHNGSAKLTASQVSEIRSLAPNIKGERGYTRDIADRFGVTPTNILYLWRGLGWMGEV